MLIYLNAHVGSKVSHGEHHRGVDRTWTVALHGSGPGDGGRVGGCTGRGVDDGQVEGDRVTEVDHLIPPVNRFGCIRPVWRPTPAGPADTVSAADTVSLRASAAVTASA